MCFLQQNTGFMLEEVDINQILNMLMHQEF